MSKEKNNIENYAVEDLAKLIIEKSETLVSLDKKIKSSQFSRENIQKLLKKVQLVESRLNKNLSFNKIIWCILIPSRKILGLFNVFNPHNELKKGFRRKVNQFYIFSILGSLFYLLSVLIFMVLNA